MTTQAERARKIRDSRRELIKSALNEAGPSGLTIGVIRIRVSLVQPRELLRGMVADGLAFVSPDEGGAKGAFRWFGTAQWRDQWHATPKLAERDLGGWVHAKKAPRFTHPADGRLMESRLPDPKPVHIRAGALDFKRCPSTAPC
jgi:hypothetical protein